MFTMCKISKIFKGHITDMFILMSFFFSFPFKTTLILIFLNFLTLKYYFSIFMFWYPMEDLGNKLGRSRIE